MAIPYTPPGVTTVTETSTSPLLPAGGILTLPALVGEALGYEVFTEQVLLTDDTPKTLSKSGAILDGGNILAVVKTTTNEAISKTNYVITQTSPSNGVINGDEVTTIKRINHAGAPTLSATAGGLTGTYRYGVAWYFGLDGESNNIESGIDESLVSQITLTSQSVNLSNIQIANPPTTAQGTATGRVVYRSKNLGTPSNPVWGPWYRIETLADLTTTTVADNNSDVSVATNPKSVASIANGDSLFVQYKYADTDYYLPTLFEDFADVIDKYGAPFDGTGNINSILSFGANMAFANGASQIIGVALPANSNIADITNALELLEDEEDVRIVVVLDGSSGTASAVSAHVTSCNNKKLYRVGIVGRDGVEEAVSVQGLRDNASAISNEAIQMISPAIVQYRNGFEGRNVNIGSQYAAAAFAGMYSSRLPQETLSRKTITGLIGLGERRTKNAKDVDAQNGLTVLEDRNGILRVRHSISTNRTSINTQEFSVTLAKHNMLHDVIAVLDDQIVGQVIADELASIHIINAVSAILDRKVSLGIIVAYQGLRARPVAGDPTTYNVDWQYKPTYTINNVSISFSININTGSTQITGAGLGGSTGLIL